MAARPARRGAPPHRRRSSGLTALVALLALVASVVGTLGLLASAAVAAGSGSGEGAVISFAEPRPDGVDVLVTLPPETEVDLADVTVDVDGVPAEATAERADEATADAGVSRTTVLAVDVSDSMAGARIAAAKEAARTYLDTVPDDVAVGVVTFAGEVSTALEPTTDRAAALDVVDALTLSGGTLLHEGVSAAVAEAGTEGQRAVVVLSDGADTGDTPVTDVAAEVTEAGVQVNAVSLEGAGGAGSTGASAAADSLLAITQAGRGSVVEAGSEDLAGLLEAQAAVLTRQVLVDVALPDTVTAERATVTVDLATGTGDVVASALVPVRSAAVVGAADDTAVPTAGGTGLLAGLPGALPALGGSWVLLPAVLLLGLGLLGVLAMLVPRAPAAVTAGDRLEQWVTSTRRDGGTEPAAPEREPVRDQAGAVVAKLLTSTGSLEGRIAHRLERAGSALQPAEWLMLHVAVVVVGTLVGAVLGGLPLGLVGLLLGALLPYLWLRFRSGRRRKAFDAALPDTLQLISGSLAAGLSLGQSIDTVVREGVEVIATEFKRVLVETRLGVPLEDALSGVATRYESKDFEWVVMAIRIQRQVGGNLAELLDTVAGTMREREYVRRQVSALAAEGKLSAIVLAVLPPAFLLYLMVANGEYVSVLFTDPRGIMILVGAGTWLGIGIFWMSKLVKVEV